ncbi:hypothetical protein [Idiomarina sp.]|uniref:hypothetical protein n=1 Tax=Idiomarina sp. TaxID=1874361 RepID=UPI002585112D|nr:hypothetical protein [Idiomarina sp.]
MKTPATFTDEELELVELLVNRGITPFTCHIVIDEAKYKRFRNNLISIRNKCWAQRHGTEATDVESV